MQLKNYTDYSLRTLIYLGSHADRVVTISEVAEAFGISRNHLMKVAHKLSLLGYVRSVPGPKGGMSLARDPEAINVGEVIRQMEKNFDIVECFNATKNTCYLSPTCVLKGILADAMKLFLSSLEQYTLKDLLFAKSGDKTNHSLESVEPP